MSKEMFAVLGLVLGAAAALAFTKTGPFAPGGMLDFAAPLASTNSRVPAEQSILRGH